MFDIFICHLSLAIQRSRVKKTYLLIHNKNAYNKTCIYLVNTFIVHVVHDLSLNVLLKSTNHWPTTDGIDTFQFNHENMAVHENNCSDRSMEV